MYFSRCLLASVLLVFSPCIVMADSWVPPTIKSYTSITGEYVFTVTPEPLSNQPFIVPKLSQETSEIQTESEYPKGRLVTASGDVLWERRLVNEVSPVSAIVSADGQYVVTFDNWYVGGYGSDVVVIYGKSGGLIRDFSLGDIVGLRRVSDLPRSIDTRLWAGEHRFESKDFLLLSVLADGADFYSNEPTFESIRVRLEDGVVIDHQTSP